jgi:predicted acylesterase/phospholipase RssA
MLNSVTIWEAARATSAASTFFERIAIGSDKEVFLDGGTGANNPVNVVCAEARDVWNFNDAIDDHLHCLISIGTGVPNVEPFGKTLLEIGKTLKAMATETEKTAHDFLRDHTKLHTEKRYFRFNVDHGLGNIGLEESGKRPDIISATRRYVVYEGTKKEMEYCAETLSVIECMLEEEFM